MAGEDRRRNNWASGVARDAPNINVLMMRFRPIAPKPPETGEPSHSLLGTPGLYQPGKAVTKRKNPRVRSQGRSSASTKCQTVDRSNLSEHREGKGEITGETRPLHSIPDHRAEESSQSVKASEGEPDPSFWHPTAGCGGGSRSGFLVKNRGNPRRTPPSCLVIHKTPLPDLNNAAFPSSATNPTLVGTSMVANKRFLDVCLIVESVVTGESCIQVAEQLLGHTNEERLTGLVAEECPGFLTDADNKVRWVNGAFERMMMAELATCGGRGEVAVRTAAVAEEDLSTYSWQAFTSRVRIQYTWRDESCPVWWGPRVVTVAPCDAWRLHSSGFAWRLDVNAALSLGRR